MAVFFASAHTQIEQTRGRFRRTQNKTSTYIYSIQYTKHTITNGLQISTKGLGSICLPSRTIHLTPDPPSVQATQTETFRDNKARNIAHENPQRAVNRSGDTIGPVFTEGLGIYIPYTYHMIRFVLASIYCCKRYTRCDKHTRYYCITRRFENVPASSHIMKEVGVLQQH